MCGEHCMSFSIVLPGDHTLTSLQTCGAVPWAPAGPESDLGRSDACLERGQGGAVLAGQGGIRRPGTQNPKPRRGWLGWVAHTHYRHHSPPPPHAHTDTHTQIIWGLPGNPTSSNILKKTAICFVQDHLDSEPLPHPTSHDECDYDDGYGCWHVCVSVCGVWSEREGRGSSPQRTLSDELLIQSEERARRAWFLTPPPPPAWMPWTAPTNPALVATAAERRGDTRRGRRRSRGVSEEHTPVAVGQRGGGRGFPRMNPTHGNRAATRGRRRW